MKTLSERIERAAESIALRWVAWGPPSTLSDGSGGVVSFRNLSPEQLADVAKFNVQAAEAAAERFGQTSDPRDSQTAAEHVMATRALYVSLAEKKGKPFAEADTPFPGVGFHWPG